MAAQQARCSCQALQPLEAWYLGQRLAQHGVAAAALEQPGAAPKAAGPPAGPPGSAVDPCAAEPGGRPHRSRAFGQLHGQV
jgi:hypothetical protein